MQEFDGDWIKWKRNPPVESHMSGVWERQIHSAWRILFSLLQTHGKNLWPRVLADTDGWDRRNIKFQISHSGNDQRSY